ncbi:MAG: MFS transporter [Thermodesulfobacteriota bacterium]|nr:MFS transporter [Thermodesulfobacteriota bacterium]
MVTTHARQPRFVLALQYFLFFGVLGIFLPFFNLYCYHLGFSGFQIGALFSARTGATVIFPLVWGALADRFAARKAIYVLCNVMAAGIWSFFLFTTDFYLMLIITTFYGIFYAPVISFMEAFSMDILGDEKSSYGKIRAWGTISFVSIVIILGRVTEVVPVSIIIPLILAGTLLQSLSAIALPPVHKQHDSIGSPKSVLGRKKVVVFLICAFLMLASHGTYYGFFSIHLENMGFGNTFIGFAWALASIAEITVMIGSRRLFARFSLESVLVFSFFVACIRWIMMFFAVSGVLILLSQLLHAVTYGAFHMASILYIDRVSTDNTKTLGQALNNAVSFGLGMMLGVFVNGIFYDYVGSTPLFLGSAVISIIGGVLLWMVFRGKGETDG